MRVRLMLSRLKSMQLSQSACEVEMATVKFKIYNHQVLFKFQKNDEEQSF